MKNETRRVRAVTSASDGDPRCSSRRFANRETGGIVSQCERNVKIAVRLARSLAAAISIRSLILADAPSA